MRAKDVHGVLVCTMAARKPPTEAETADASVRATLDAAGARPAILVAWHCRKPASRALLLRPSVPITLGRSVDTELALPDDEQLSRRHVSVTATEAGFRVEDLKSRNGCFLGGRRLVDVAQVTGNAVLRAGGSVFLLLRDGRRFATGKVQVLDGNRVLGPDGLEAKRAIESAAEARRTLLIVGESGTGKELAAKDYHEATRLQPTSPFVVVNSSAIPEPVAESLLFGAKKGAYTGADRDAEGYFERADGGVLFLDEVGLLSPAVQQKLLRAVETKEILPLGARTPKRVDVLICAATNEDLRAAVTAGRFRADLYQRIAQRTVTLLPLRARPEEIPFLVERAVQKFVQQQGGSFKVTADFIEACLLRQWITNVRELTSAVDMACDVARQRDGELRSTDLPAEGPVTPEEAVLLERMVATQSSRLAAAPHRPEAATVKMPSARDFRKEKFRDAYLRNAGDVAKAAAEVGISPSIAYDYLKELQQDGATPRRSK